MVTLFDCNGFKDRGVIARQADISEKKRTLATIL